MGSVDGVYGVKVTHFPVEEVIRVRFPIDPQMKISEDLLREKRDKLQFQLDVPELAEILSEINPPLNFLVFGLGNDSLFWSECNKGGRTVFLEDLESWRDKMAVDHPELETYLIHYETVRSDWRELIDHPKKLQIRDIPEDIRGIKWDVIFVDGPMGYKDSSPGRMKSIYEASSLIKPGGHVFVHDTGREVEAAYCSRYLLSRNFVRQVSGFSILNHYCIQCLN